MVSIGNRPPIGALETSLRSLRSSQLMDVPEFQQMFKAIQNHQKEGKLSKLMKTPKDLQKKAEKDSKFYLILSNMLCEVSRNASSNQVSNLKTVYKWYRTNGSQLNSVPKFGKSTKNKVNSDLRLVGHGKELSPRQGRKKSTSNGDKDTVSRVLSYIHTANKGSVDNSLSDKLSVDWTISRPPSVDSEVSLKINQCDDDEIYEVDHDIVDHYQTASSNQLTTKGDNPLPSPERITSAGRRRVDPNYCQPSSSILSNDIKHPITSLVNPHSTDRIQQDTDGRLNKVQFHHNKDSKHIEAWNEFQHNLKNNQSVLSNLSFVGRSGTPYDVRYIAHDEAEIPEYFVNQAVGYSRRKKKQAKNGVKITDGKSIYSKSLMEFCETTDGYYPHGNKKYPVKPRSAPPGRRPGHGHQTRPQSCAPGHIGHDQGNKIDFQAKASPNVKVNTIMSVIDKVTSNMTHFKEKVAPEPRAGFRPPSSTVPQLPPSRPVSVPSATIKRSSPVTRPLSAVISPPAVIHPQNKSCPNLHIDISPSRRSPETPKRPSSPVDGVVTVAGNYPQLTTPVDQLGQALDWRGKVSPDVVNHKWKQSGLGSHTYVKSLKEKKRTLSASRRPRTTGRLAARRQHYQFENQNAHCSFIPSRSAAGSRMTSIPVDRPDSRAYPIDQEDVDEMLQVKYLGGTSEEYPHHWFQYDKDLLARFSETQLDERVRLYKKPPPHLEFLSLIIPKESITGVYDYVKDDKNTEDHNIKEDTTNLSDTDDFTDTDSVLSTNKDEEKSESDLDLCYASEHSIEGGSEQDIIASEKGETASVIGGGKDHGNDQSLLVHKETASVIGGGEDDQSLLVNKETASVIGGGEDHGIDQSLLINKETVSVIGGGKDHGNDKSLLVDKDLHINLDEIVKEDTCDTPRQRRLSLHARTFSDPWEDSTSIPSARGQNVEFSPKRPFTGRVYLSSRQEAQNDPLLVEMYKDRKNQRSAGRSLASRSQSASVQGRQLMLRKPGDLAPPPRTAPSIPTGRRSFSKKGHNLTFMAELDHHARRVETAKQYIDNVNLLRCSSARLSTPRIDQSDDLSSGILTISQLTKHNHHIRTQQTGDVNLIEKRQGMEDVSREMITCTESHTGVNTEDTREGTCLVNRENEGRPIPTVVEVQDPVLIANQVERQKQAKAAVDIQRIFRGYVTRNYCVRLEKEKRERKEDELKAAMAIQRAFRAHQRKMSSIYHRPKLGPDLQTWAKDYEMVKKISEVDREVKRQDDANQMTRNYVQAANRLSTIGPHVEIYQIYHQKSTGPTMTFLHQAATVIQRYVRGFLIRKKLLALKRKALYQGSNWTRCVQEYRHVLWKVQERHAVLRPKMPFQFAQMKEFMDTRRRYESIFEKKAFGGEIEVSDLPQFFKECDLYPSQTEMDDAVDVVVRGSVQPSRGLYKSEVLEVLFYIYPPPAAGLTNHRKSTWLNPIIDGEEANKLIGSDQVEDAPLSVCVKLVVDAKRERLQREKQLRNEEDSK